MWEAQEGRAQGERCSHKGNARITCEELGFSTGKISPCHFLHEGWQECGLVHGDVFACIGRQMCLETMSKHIAGKLKAEGGVLRALSRSLKWTMRGMVYSRDQSRADRMVQKLPLGKKHVDLGVPQGAQKI